MNYIRKTFINSTHFLKKKSVVIHNTNWQDQINSYYLTTISNARHMRSPVTF